MNDHEGMGIDDINHENAFDMDEKAAQSLELIPKNPSFAHDDEGKQSQEDTILSAMDELYIDLTNANLIDIAKNQIDFSNKVHFQITLKQAQNNNENIEHYIKGYKKFMENLHSILVDKDNASNIENKISSVAVLIHEMGIETELLWRVHMLNSLSYYQDCMRSFGQIMPFFIDPNQLKINMIRLYYDNNININITNNIDNGEDNKNNIDNNISLSFNTSINLVDATKRQLEFINGMNRTFFKSSKKISMDHDKLLSKSLVRYCAFLMLKKIQIKLGVHFSLVPRIDIHLLWHSHLLNPISYHNTCQKIFANDNNNNNNSCGPIFNHNDEIDIDGSALIQNGIKTKNLWNNTFENFQNNDISNYENDSFKFISVTLIKYHNIIIDVNNTLKTERLSTNDQDNINNCGNTVLAGLCLIGIVLIVFGAVEPNGVMMLWGIIVIVMAATFIMSRKCDSSDTNIVATSNIPV